MFFVVAGATGHVGSAVAGELLARDQTIRVIVRDPSRAAGWTARGAEVSVGSLDDPAFLTRALDGASGFFTILPEDLAYPDFHGHRRQIADATTRAVKQSRVPHVVMQSAMSASLTDGSGPGEDLHYLEQSLLGTGTRLTRHRACYYQDNVGMALAPARQAGIYPSLMPPDLAFPMIATADVGRFAAQALMSPPARSEVVDLMGPAYSIRQVAEQLGAALGKPIHIVEIPPAGQVDALTQAGLPQSVAEAVAEMFAAFAAGRIRPEGDRTLMGSTTIDEVLRRLLSARTEAEAR